MAPLHLHRAGDATGAGNSRPSKVAEAGNDGRSAELAKADSASRSVEVTGVGNGG